MERYSRKLQKWVTISAAIGAVMVFVLALSFATDISVLLEHLDPNDRVGYVKGAYSVFYSAQDFNFVLFILAGLMLASVLGMFVFFSQSRRVYYLSNYIVISIFTALCIVTAVFILASLIPLRDSYLYAVEWDTYRAWAETYNLEFVKSTFWFDAGIVVGILLVILSGALILNLLLKVRSSRILKQKYCL